MDANTRRARCLDCSADFQLTATMLSSDSTPTTPYFQADFPPEEFAARRHRVAEAIGADAVAVLRGAPASGAFDLFRQSNEFYYLSGVEEPHAYLLISGDGGTTLYLPPRDPHVERSEGPTLNADQVEIAATLTGITRVRPLAALAGDLREARVVYTPHQPAECRQACRDMLRFARHLAEKDPWADPETAQDRFRARLRSAAPTAELRDLSPLLDDLRLVKSPREIAQMRRAGQLTAQAVVEAIRATRPGVVEFQLAAVADYVFQVNGAQGGGYRPIVAGGANIWNAHYYRNHCTLVDGDLVLMDYAPDLGCYTSDIGRMWPVNGRYSPVQRELYGFMVQYHRTFLSLLRPGVTPEEVLQEAAAEMRPVVERTPWTRDVYREAARRALEYRGHLSHPVGMAVHDVGSYFGQPMQPGLVFALDPQMWVPEEQLYVRVEDTVAITETGVEVLTREAPLDLDEVEALVGSGGIPQAIPPLQPGSP